MEPYYSELGVRATFSAARAKFRSGAPRILALLAGWVGVWVVIEILVFVSRSPPGHPIWLVLHFSYFWGTSYWEAAILRSALASYGAGGSGWVFSEHRLVLRFLAVKLLLLPVILMTTALAVIPGLYVAARYGLAPVFVVDRGAGPLVALSLSARATRGRRFRLMKIYLALLLFNVLGAAILGLGLLITLPMTALATAWIFLQLRSGP